MAESDRYNPGPGPRYITDEGFECELTGGRDPRDGKWHNMEEGGRPPEINDWDEIDLVTVNLDPDKEKGFYRSFIIEVGGFDEVYGIADLIENAAEDYGFVR